MLFPLPRLANLLRLRRGLDMSLWVCRRPTPASPKRLSEMTSFSKLKIALYNYITMCKIKMLRFHLMYYTVTMDYICCTILSILIQSIITLTLALMCPPIWFDWLLDIFIYLKSFNNETSHRTCIDSFACSSPAPTTTICELTCR